MATGNAQFQWRTVVNIEGIQLEDAIKWTGGEKTSSPGVSYDDKGGHPTSAPASRSDGTATFNYTPALHLLKSKFNVGWGAATVTRTPSGDDGTVYPGGEYAMSGKIREFGEPDEDKGSSDATTIDIIFSLDVNLLTQPKA